PEQNCRVAAWPLPTNKFVPVRSRHLTALHYFSNIPFSSGRQEPHFVTQSSLNPTAAAEFNPPAFKL
ncbi:hypothetical protein ACVGXP_01615, partial [Enterobacter hormaechei]